VVEALSKGGHLDGPTDQLWDAGFGTRRTYPIYPDSLMHGPDST